MYSPFWICWRRIPWEVDAWIVFFKAWRPQSFSVQNAPTSFSNRASPCYCCPGWRWEYLWRIFLHNLSLWKLNLFLKFIGLSFLQASKFFTNLEYLPSTCDLLKRGITGSQTRVKIGGYKKFDPISISLISLERNSSQDSLNIKLADKLVWFQEGRTHADSHKVAGRGQKTSDWPIVVRWNLPFWAQQFYLCPLSLKHHLEVRF